MGKICGIVVLFGLFATPVERPYRIIRVYIFYLFLFHKANEISYECAWNRLLEMHTILIFPKKGAFPHRIGYRDATHHQAWIFEKFGAPRNTIFFCSKLRSDKNKNPRKKKYIEKASTMSKIPDGSFPS